MTTHTPGKIYAVQPEECHGWWILAKNEDGDPLDESGDGGFERETAEHLVHTWNCHDELVEALGHAVRIASGEQPGNWDDVMQYASLVEKAKGE